LSLAIGGVAALVQYLEGAKSAGSRSYVNSAWALANLAADSPPNQVPPPLTLGRTRTPDFCLWALQHPKTLTPHYVDPDYTFYDHRRWPGVGGGFPCLGSKASQLEDAEALPNTYRAAAFTSLSRLPHLGRHGEWHL